MQHAKEQPTPTMPGAMPFSMAHGYRSCPRCCSGTALRRVPEVLLGSAPALVALGPCGRTHFLEERVHPSQNFPPRSDHPDHVSRKPYTL